MSELKKTISFNTVKEFCVICNKRVFATEKTFVNNRIYHTECFRCSKCKTKLNISSFGQNGDSLFCKNHLPVTTKKETPKKPDSIKIEETKVDPKQEETESPRKGSTQPKPSTGFKVSKEFCVHCQKPVYLLDKQIIDGRIYHQFCLKCTHCKCKLTLGNFSQIDNTPYCKTHYIELFKRKGSFNFQEKKKDEIIQEPKIEDFEMKKDETIQETNKEEEDLKKIQKENQKNVQETEFKRRKGLKMTIEIDCSFFFNYEGLDLEFYEKLEKSNKEPEQRKLTRKIEVSSFFFDENFSLDDEFYQKVKDAVYEPKLRQPPKKVIDQSFFFNSGDVDISDYHKFQKSLEDDPIPKERISKMNRNPLNPDFFFTNVSIDLSDYHEFIEAVNAKYPKLRSGAKPNTLDASFFFNITNFKISEEDYQEYTNYVNQEEPPKPKMRKGAREISTPQFFFTEKGNEFLNHLELQKELEISSKPIENIPKPRQRRGTGEISTPKFFFDVKGDETLKQDRKEVQELFLPTFEFEKDEEESKIEPIENISKPKQRKGTGEISTPQFFFHQSDEPKLRLGAQSQTIDFSFFFNAQITINLDDYKPYQRAIEDQKITQIKNDEMELLRRKSAPSILKSKHDDDLIIKPRKRSGTKGIQNPSFFFDKTETRDPQLRKNSKPITFEFSFFFKPELEISLSDYDPFVKSLNEESKVQPIENIPKPRQRRGTGEISTPQFFFKKSDVKEEDTLFLQEILEDKKEEEMIPEPRQRKNTREISTPQFFFKIHETSDDHYLQFNEDLKSKSDSEDMLTSPDPTPKPRQRKGTGEISTPQFFFKMRTSDGDQSMESPFTNGDDSSPRSDITILSTDDVFKTEENKIEENSTFEPKLRKGKNNCTVEVSFFFKPVEISVSDYDHYLDSLKEEK